MPDEPHYPSKWTAAIVFLIIFLLIGGIFAWAFYFNYGTLALRAEQRFTAEVQGEAYSCDRVCEIDLPHGSYDAIVRSEGYYDQSFSVDIQRFQAFEKNLVFDLIPYLKPISVQEVPDESALPYRFVAGVGTEMNLVSQDGVLITSFESLQAPSLQVVGDSALVLDSGRAFFVTLADGKKLRRFDDTIQVNDARLSDHAKRTLFSVAMQDTDFLWVWLHESSELMTLAWNEPMGRVQWQPGVDHRLFVISDQLRDASQASLIDQVVESVQPNQRMLGLFSYNIDTDEAQLLASFFDKNPLQLMRRGDRYFVEYEGGAVEELVVK